MKLLIVCATFEELKLIKDNSGINATDAGSNTLKYKNLYISFLVTGVGMVATTYYLLKKLMSEKYDLVIDIGVAGCFSKQTEIGTVFHVISDCFADLGAEDDQEFISTFAMGLSGLNEYPFTEGKLINLEFKMADSIKNLPVAHAVTVNKVHGNANSIGQIIKRYNPDLESMEGAAVFYCCLLEKVPFYQLRAVSNLVEKRNRNAWNLPLALKNLESTVFQLLDEISANCQEISKAK